MGSVRGYQVHQVSNRGFPSKNMFVKNPTEPADIVGMSGFIANGVLHPHITLATPDKSFGGHLEPGTNCLHFRLRDHRRVEGRSGPESRGRQELPMRRATVLGIALAALAWCADKRSEVWKFDSIAQIGGHKVTAEGHPRVIATPAGKAVEFGGVEDALFLNVHPLAGAETFTWEVIFRPDVGGAAEQRFFHFQENGTETRMLFEIRVRDGKWCLDSFAQSGTESKALLNCEKLHTLGDVASRGGGVRRTGIPQLRRR